MKNKRKYFPLFYLGSMALILPLVYFGNSLDPVLLPRVIALSIMILLSLIVITFKISANSGNWDFAVLRNYIFPIFLLYLIYSSIALSGAINIGEGIFDISKIILAMATLIISTLVIQNFVNARLLLARLFIISGLILAIIGTFQYFGIGFNFFRSHGLPSGTSVNRNLFLALLATIIPYSVYGSLILKRAWKFAGIAAGLLMLFLIVVGSTRAVWVGCVIASAVCLILYFAAFRNGKRSKNFVSRPQTRFAILVISLLVVLIFAGGFFITKSRGPDIFSKAASIFNDDLPSNYNRIALWKNTSAMSLDHPIIGVGPGNWKINLAKYGPIGNPGIVKIRFFQRPHNDFLWVLSEKGFPGLILYMGIFALAIFYALKIIIKSPLKQYEQRYFALFTLWGIIVYLADSFFSFPMERMLNTTFIMLTISAVVSLYQDTFKSQKRDLSKAGKLTIVVPLILVVAFSGIIGFIRSNSEIHTKDAMIYREKSDWNNVIREIKKAESKLASLDPTSTPLAWYSGEAYYMLGEYDSAFADYKRAYKYNPNHLHVLNNLGTLYEMRGEHNKAVEMFQRALIANPDFNETLINLAAVYYNTGQYEKANETISRVATDCPDPRYPLFMQKIKDNLK